jgi:hypothetical protein
MKRLHRLEQQQHAAGSAAKIEQPLNVVDFSVNPNFLGLRLFPRQLTVIKLLVLALDLLTPYDYEVIAAWASGYTQVDDMHGVRWAGRHGIVPDVLERARHCIAAGRWSFTDIVLVLGRRASKSLISSVVLAWTCWRLLMLGDPQQHFGIPKSKQITLLAYSVNQASAKRDVFGDLRGLIRNAPCFQPFIDEVSGKEIRLFTPAQLARGDKAKGLPGLISISASSTVASSGRGPATFGVLVDEAAHLDGAGSTSDAETLIRAARPGLKTFPHGALTIMPSSPWSMTGGFYEGFRRATAIDPTTGRSVDMKSFALQLPSWDLYLDYEQGPELPLWPDGPPIGETPPPFLVNNDDLETERDANPEAFAVEFEAQFAAGRNTYLSELTRGRLFGPFLGALLQDQDSPKPGKRYWIHVDPSTSGDTFAGVIGHVEEHDDKRHLLIDHTFSYRPSQYPSGAVDYENVVIPDLIEYCRKFRPTDFTFDNHNVPIFTDILAPALRNLHIETHVHKVSAARTKFARYEAFKTAINLGLVHCPRDPLAMIEAEFLMCDGEKIGHPDSGPCQHDDLIDAISWFADLNLGDGASTHRQLGSLRPLASDVAALFSASYHKPPPISRNAARPIRNPRYGR